MSTLPRNKRALILFEPMWSVPFGLVSVYASLYQERLGVSAVSIGLISSIGMAVYTVSSLFGGVLSDRLGRRRALLYSDLLAWTLPTLIWALAKDFRYFLVAAVLNGMGGVAEIAFTCLLVEDTDGRGCLAVFSWIQFCDLLSGLFLPLAGLAVGILGVVTATRALYWIAFVSMTFMFFARYRALSESSVGLKRMAETKGTPPFGSLAKMGGVLRLMLRDRTVLALFLVSVITRVRYGVFGIYLALFLTRRVGLEPPVVAAFPTIFSVMTFLVTIAVIPALGYNRAPTKLAVGLLGSAAGILAIGMANTGNAGLLLALAGGVILGASNAMINPYLSTAWHNALADDTRAEVLSVAAVLRMLLVAPSGYIAGLVFSRAPALLMFGVSGLLVLGFGVLTMGGHLRERQPG